VILQTLQALSHHLREIPSGVTSIILLLNWAKCLAIGMSYSSVLPDQATDFQRKFAKTDYIILSVSMKKDGCRERTWRERSFGLFHAFYVFMESSGVFSGTKW
jgi:hypothetical protein